MGNSPPVMLGKAPRSKRAARTAAVSPSPPAAATAAPSGAAASTSTSTVTPVTANSNLDADVRKPTPPKLLWHQPVNIFLTRPVGVEELHHEAELNLQNLLQEEYEEPYSEAQIGSQTFRYADGPLDCSPRPPPAKRLEFVFMPTSQQAKENESSTLGVRAPEPSISLPTTPDKQIAWTKGVPLPSLDEKRLHQSCLTQANIVPINVSGQPFARHASTRHSLFNTETAMNPKSLLRRRRTVIGFPHLSMRDPGNNNGPIFNPPATIAESVSCNFVPEKTSRRGSTHHVQSPQPRPQLRKTFSDLGGVLQGRCCQGTPGHSENPELMCSNSSHFSPAWSAASFGYVSSSSVQNKPGPDCTTQLSPRVPSGTPDSNRPASFFIDKDNVVENNGSETFCAPPDSSVELKGDAQSGGRDAKPQLLLLSPGKEECPQLGKGQMACRFRERSLSVPTDTASLCSVDIGGSETCGLSYPSASSEGSTSTDNVPLVVDQEARVQQRRQRTKSISLKKAKKKPSPPTRSVSLIKDVQVSKPEAGGDALPQEQRPKSLCLLPEGQVPNQGPREAAQEPESSPYSQQWYLPEWSSGDPYCSLSSSSTATGTTVIERSKIHGSSDSLPSPSVSRATTPSQLSAELNLKTSSPGRPTGVMSPSSGYSSQSETPTPTIPMSTVLGHGPHQSGRMRPLVPERKSSLPPVSPMERSPKSQLSFDLPFALPTHLDLSGLKISLKGKPKVSRHHSDSTFGIKLGPKLSPVQPVMPMVTQLDLRSVRLRSVSRSETEDNPDSPEFVEEPGKKVRPPVAEKPPLSRRPPMLLHKTPPVQEESPVGSPTSSSSSQGFIPIENIYLVAKRPDQRWDGDSWSPVDLPSPIMTAPSAQDPSGTFLCSSRRLSEDSIEEDDQLKPKLPEEKMSMSGSRKAKIPPPVPKKPSMLYLPLVTSPPHPENSRLGSSPVIMLEEDSTCSEMASSKVLSPVGNEGNISPSTASVSWGDISGNSVDLGMDEKSYVSDKTAESITEDDDDVFMMSRTTEDLFTVIHRSKRKLLGWKESSDASGSRQNSKGPMGSLSVDSSMRTSTKNEDFKALLQKKGGKGTSGIRTSAAELLKTTNPLARRVMTEFAVDGTIFGSQGPP